MQIQFNSDNSIEATQDMAINAEATVRSDLEHFGDRVTRVEIHLSDENSDTKAGARDKRCQIEVRLAGLDPRSATHKAPTVEEAVIGASAKIRRQLESVVGKLNNRNHEKLTEAEQPFEAEEELGPGDTP